MNHSHFLQSQHAPDAARLCIVAALAVAVALAGCSQMPAATTPASAPAAVPAVSPAPAPAATGAPAAGAAALATASSVPDAAPEPAPFEDAVTRAARQLLADAGARLGPEPRVVVIDPLIDANTGAQTVSTDKMGEQLAALVARTQPRWTVQPLTRQALAAQPLLLIGTLTPVNVERAIDTPPDAFRIWLTMIDLRTQRVVSKRLDRATVGTVNPEPLKFFSDSPTWHKDKTVAGYINSCQINTKAGDPADPDYLSRLNAAAVINEAILAYNAGRVPVANKLYREAASLADPGDLRVLNGLYLTSWQLGQRDAARQAFNGLVASGLEARRLPIKLLFDPGRTTFKKIGDLPEQYDLWLASLARETGRTNACVRVVGHTSRTGSARLNEVLSRKRAEAVAQMLDRRNRAIASRLSVAGVGSREALVGLGTDDLRDALDRRVEFRVVDCI